MAKQPYGDGTHITPALMNAYWGIDGDTGHVHDGTDADGSVPKVMLTEALEVQGVLPGANIEAPLPTANIDHQHGVSGLALVDGVDDIDFGTGSVDWTSSDVTGGLIGTFYYQSHGKMVHVFNYADKFDGIIDHTVLKIYPQTTWPAAIRTPPSPQRVPMIVFQGGTQNSGTISVPYDSTSVLNLGYTDANGKIQESTGWSGDCGLGYSTFSYYKSDA